MADRTRLGLLADEPAAAALRARVRALQRAVDRRLRLLAQRVDERSVHEARIAARRLRVVLRGFAGALEPSIARPYRRVVAELADALQRVRDADVAVQQIDALADGDARAESSLPVRARLVRRRARARRALRTAMRREDWRRRRSAMRAAAANFALVVASADPVGTLAARVLARRRRRVRRALRALRDPRRHPRAAHRLRLAVKALRYLAEECRPSTSGPHEREIEWLHELQDVLGELRDVEALRREIGARTLRRRCDRRARALRRRYRARRRALLGAWGRH